MNKKNFNEITRYCAVIIALFSIVAVTSYAAFDIHDVDVPVTNRYGYSMLTEVYRFADTTNAVPVKYPVIFCRTQYSRKQDDEANNYTGQGFIYISQNVSGSELSSIGSPGTSVYHFGSFDSETNFVAETYDAIEWIVQQPWCNGRIGMVGGSGNGIGASMALWCGHTNLVAVDITHSVANFQHYWYFRNGVKRQMFTYCIHRGISWNDFDWPRPNTYNFKKQRWIDFITERAVSNNVAYFESSGVYDIFNEAAFDNFTALAHNGRAHVTMGEKHHAGTIDYREYGAGFTNITVFPSKTKPVFNATFMDYMNGNVADGQDASMLRYYVIGDPRDVDSPGNDWKTTEQWPIATTSSNFYFYSDGTISNCTPPSGNIYLSYTYNPTNPVFIPGGSILLRYNDTKNHAGPMDQRVLSNRTDVLKFVSPPLTSPLEIIGNIDSTLYISTDAIDTLFVATLVDYNPDGYQAILAQSAVMARYWSGEDSPAGLTPNVVYKLEMDMWSTTAILDTGHRIGVHITSSSAQNADNTNEEVNTYEIHPNTYDPVSSYSETKVAHQNIHLSAEYPSHITLPVIAAPEPSTNTVVTTTADSGAGSLRDILENAANNADITFDLPSYPGIITLQSSIGISNTSLNIIGRENPTDIVINGNNAYRIFDIYKNISISGITISNGLVAGNGGGISVNSDACSFTMSNCVVTSCKLSGVVRMGAGLYVNQRVDATILYSTFCNNTTDGNNTDGGAVFFDSATWGDTDIRKIENCSFYNNHTADDGGALQIRNKHETTIVNSTFFNNVCPDQGGAIASYSPEGSLKIFNCTFVDNRGGTGGGISLFGNPDGTAEIYSSILSNTASVSGANLRDPANFDVIDHCCFPESPAGNNNVIAQPEINSSLADNGGPTLSLMPTQSGNCVNSGTNILSLTFDQRGPGFSRTLSGATDIGAVEYIPESGIVWIFGLLVPLLRSLTPRMLGGWPIGRGM